MFFSCLGHLSCWLSDSLLVATSSFLLVSDASFSSTSIGMIPVLFPFELDLQLGVSVSLELHPFAEGVPEKKIRKRKRRSETSYMDVVRKEYVEGLLDYRLIDPL
ncbi:hypothetical protein Tco_1574613 [Tanacetum coccineum]